jgi:hypothetical protein
MVVTKRKRGGVRHEEAEAEVLQLAKPHTHTGPCAQGGRGGSGGRESTLEDGDGDADDDAVEEVDEERNEDANHNVFRISVTATV